MEILPFLILPFLASLILTGIHSYLGVHVVERGVIFVDLALAQIAALGAIVAIIAGMDPHGRGAYWISLGFTFLGAAIFAFARTRRGHIPQEAFIGIAYAVASAMAILLMSKATGETEHLKDMLVGNILAVSRPEVIKTALLYSGIGLFHFIFRKKFLLISMNHNKAEQTGLNVRFWDFLFYASFGFVVTSSVAIAGVLLVFCYLIVPSVGAMLFADRIGPRHRLDHGHAGLRAGRLSQRSARYAHRRDHRRHLRRRPHRHVSSASRLAPRPLRPRTERWCLRSA
jgi:zinc/manganese transport system permease protein